MERLSLKLAQDPAGLIEDFCKDCRLRGMTNESIRRYKSSLLIFARFLLKTVVDIDSADAHALKDFLEYIKNEKGVKKKINKPYTKTP